MKAKIIRPNSLDNVEVEVGVPVVHDDGGL